MKIYLKLLALCLVSTLGIFALHYFFPSMLNLHTSMENPWDYKNNINHGFMQEVYEYHLQHPAFMRRPLTSYTIEGVHNLLGLSYANSFILVNFGFLFFCGIALFALVKSIKQNNTHALGSVFLFYTSFAVLFGFMIPVYAYDEPMQYLLIFLSLIFLVNKKWPAFATTFFLAVLARETSLLLIPGLLILLASKKHWHKDVIFLRTGFSLLLIGVVYLFVLHYVGSSTDYGGLALEYMKNDRFSHYQYNFQSLAYGLESLVSFILAIGLPMFILLEYAGHFKLKKTYQRWYLAFFATVFLNTILVLVSAKAQEARLFALPLIFAWPMLAKAVHALWKLCRKSIVSLKREWKFHYGRLLYVGKLFETVTMLVLATLLSFWVYQPTNETTFAFGFQLYLFGIIVIILLYKLFTYRKS